jgi:hypothetical protein
MKLEDNLKCWIGKDVGGIGFFHMKTQLFFCLRGLRANTAYVTIENLAGRFTPAFCDDSRQVFYNIWGRNDMKNLENGTGVLISP